MALVLAVLFAMASAGTLAAATAVQVANAIGQIGDHGTVQNGQSGPDEHGQHDGAPAGGVVTPTPESATGNQGLDENQNANDRDGGQDATSQGGSKAGGDGSAANDNDGGANEPNQPTGPASNNDGAVGQSGGQSFGAGDGANGQDGN